MPIDINSLRVDRGGDPEAVREAQRKRFKDDGLVDNVLALDQKWRELVTTIRNMKTELNKLQKDVIAPKMKEKKNCETELAQAQQLRKDIEQREEEHDKCEHERDQLIGKLGNMVDASVPFSNDEDADNEIVASWWGHLPGENPLTHDELLWRIGGYDPERGSKVAGGRGYFLRDVGVLLNQALINFAIAFLRDRGYSPIQVPFFMKKELMAGIAQLADFDEQLYKVTTGRMGSAEDPADKYLIATSEQPLCAFHCKEVLDERELPLRYAGVSTCFRKEVGKANADNRGIFRVHQFEKVEQFCITAGDLEESRKMHQEMLRCAQDFHEALGISYRVVNIVSGELNDAAMIKYDLEGWFPGQGQYRELVSCSNCTDFQSRALDVRCRSHIVDHQNKSTTCLSHVHMLNSTLTATGRGICCILETYQTPDGVRVPEVLVPYMGGTRFIPFVRVSRELENCANAPKPAVARHNTNEKKLEQPSSTHRPTSVNGVMQLHVLEANLHENPYIDGFVPSQADAASFSALGTTYVDPGKYPNIHRWQQHVASFTPLQRRSWG